ncbi:MAG: FAD-dependent oxidoreductase [Pirellulales bacterium]
MAKRSIALGIQFRLPSSGAKGLLARTASSPIKAHQLEILERLIEEMPRVTLRQEQVEDLVIEGTDPQGIVGVRGCAARCSGPQGSVITTGTFLQAPMHTGEAKTAGGRAGEGTERLERGLWLAAA